MGRRTPSIYEQYQSYSAIVRELLLLDEDDNTTFWIPEEDAKDFVTFEDLLATENHHTYSGYPKKRVKVQTPQEDIIYKMKCTENGNFVIYDMTHKQGVRKVEVAVDHSDFMEKIKVTKNGTYTPGEGYLGISEVEAEVREELPPNPSPEDVFMDQITISENGEYTMESLGLDAYRGANNINIQVIRDKKLSHTILTDTIDDEEIGYCASCVNGDIIEIFSDTSWHHLDTSTDGLTTTALSFNATGLSAFLADGKIHLVGTDDRTPVHRVYENGAWTTLPTESIPSKCKSPNMVYVDDEHIYMVGSGYDWDGPSVCNRNMYRYNALTDTWTDIGTLPGGNIYNLDDAIYDPEEEKIHFWGAYHYVFDVETETWSTEGETHAYFRASYYKLVKVGDMIYMIHGPGSTGDGIMAGGSSITSYNMKTGLYRTEGYLAYDNCISGQITQFGFGQNATVADGHIYVYGGTSGIVNPIDKINVVNRI